MNIIITGGAGFIGSALVRFLVQQENTTVLNIDKLTYAGNLSSLQDVADAPNYRFMQTDICNAAALRQAFTDFQPDLVMHLAAESNVDRSINAPAAFIQTNIVGTYTLLETARSYYETLNGEKKQRFRFHHISTDEVFGSLDANGSFTETSPYRPRSPYSASKAGSDHLVKAWFHTYGVPVVITNCSNNYGPYQFPEKLIPLLILNALEHKPLPMYGKGDNVRDWLYVEDHVRAIVLAAAQGKVGETYTIGGRCEKTNLEVAEAVCSVLDEKRRRKHGSYRDLITFVADRPGHDQRYAIDPVRIETELGWKAEVDFETGIVRTVDWYLENETWWKPIREQKYSGERLGAYQK